MLGNVCETKLVDNVFQEAHEWGRGGGLGLERGEYARKCMQSDSTYAYTFVRILNPYGNASLQACIITKL